MQRYVITELISIYVETIEEQKSKLMEDDILERYKNYSFQSWFADTFPFIISF